MKNKVYAGTMIRILYFNGLYIYKMNTKASKRLNELKEPCIIISASGMADAGRIKHHIKNNIENPRNTILTGRAIATPIA